MIEVGMDMETEDNVKKNIETDMEIETYLKTDI